MELFSSSTNKEFNFNKLSKQFNETQTKIINLITDEKHIFYGTMNHCYASITYDGNKRFNLEMPAKINAFELMNCEATRNFVVIT